MVVRVLHINLTIKKSLIRILKQYLARRKRRRKMPAKLKASQKIRDRATGKTRTEHYYLKCMTLKELNDYIESSSAKKKVIQKCKNEIIRRSK
jgi:hypothetical protein|tara:strand:- start:186 stop:464 length:279 start_codon:yes stop_codon:yes gene_type:complete